jgi:hypothetical protein
MAWNVIAGKQRKEHSQGQENAPPVTKAGNFTKTQPKKDQLEASAVKYSSEENDAAYWREYDRRQKECAKIPRVKVPKDYLLKVKEAWVDSEGEAGLNKMPDDPWAQYARKLCTPVQAPRPCSKPKEAKRAQRQRFLQSKARTDARRDANGWLPPQEVSPSIPWFVDDVV